MGINNREAGLTNREGSHRNIGIMHEDENPGKKPWRRFVRSFLRDEAKMVPSEYWAFSIQRRMTLFLKRVKSISFTPPV